ncbi:hypothetical protein K0M31_016349, partial [Melipona bicolor]
DYLGPRSNSSALFARRPEVIERQRGYSGHYIGKRFDELPGVSPFKRFWGLGGPEAA